LNWIPINLPLQNIPFSKIRGETLRKGIKKGFAGFTCLSAQPGLLSSVSSFPYFIQKNLGKFITGFLFKGQLTPCIDEGLCLDDNSLGLFFPLDLSPHGNIMLGTCCEPLDSCVLIPSDGLLLCW
jgi:hypothetical protein